MRLLSWTAQGTLTLSRDLGPDEIPPFAILSHTWGPDDQEVTFDDFLQGPDCYGSKAGFKKIQLCGEQARRDNIDHFWVDTCCINKANNTELSEAITSMYRWYRRAKKCYVYLADVSTADKDPSQTYHDWYPDFESSRWFTRGWTLQELLAPEVVEFFSADMALLGTKESLATQIHEITTIPLEAFQNTSPSQFSIAERMRWAKSRKTKKPEDQAYCLLGIFDVFMPLIYGEGDNAFRRLEREIDAKDGQRGAFTSVANDEAFRLGLCFKTAPLIKTTDFVGRADEMNTIDALLEPKATHTEQRRVILAGIGGIGKTQLAIAYARQHQEEFSSVFWLNATSESTLHASIRSIAMLISKAGDVESSDKDQILVCVHQWLSQRENKKWLLIFDNYDEPEEYDITQFYPNIGHGSIIVTTRLPELVTGEMVRVQPFAEINDGLSILQKRSGRTNVHKDAGAQRLARRLQGYPLALASMGALLRKSTMTFQQCLDAYEEKWHIDRRRPLQLQDYHDRTLYSTWTLSYNRLEADDPDAAQMLKVLAFFDNQEVRYPLLHTGLSDASPAWLRKLLTDESTFSSIMATLVEYCLVEVNAANQSYGMHNCVHDWTLRGLNDTVDHNIYYFAFDCVYKSICDQEGTAFMKVEYNSIAHHAVRLAHSHFDGVTNTKAFMQKLIDGGRAVGSLLRGQLHLSAAERIFSSTLAAYDTLRDPNDIGRLCSAIDLGCLYMSQEKLSQAQRVFEQETAIYEGNKEHSLDLANLATLHGNLALVYSRQGLAAQAEQFCRDGLNRVEGRLGANHTAVLKVKNILGNSCVLQEKYAEAETILLEISTISNPDPIIQLTTMNTLGIVFSSQDRFDDAREVFSKALAKYEEILGPEHLDTLLTVNNLGFLYARHGKLGEARAMFKRVVTGSETVLGQNHWLTCSSAGCLHDVSRALGQFEEADLINDQYDISEWVGELCISEVTDKTSATIAEESVVQ